MSCFVDIFRRVTSWQHQLWTAGYTEILLASLQHEMLPITGHHLHKDVTDEPLTGCCYCQTNNKEYNHCKAYLMPVAFCLYKIHVFVFSVESFFKLYQFLESIIEGFVSHIQNVGLQVIL